LSNKETPAPVPPQAFPVLEACRILGISRAHIYRLERDGVLRMTRLGGRTLVTQNEINRVLGAAA
jgi:excisionase family DNA binding protein